MILDDILDLSPVIPVVSITNLVDAVPLARALLAGGVGVIEITLRTDCALTAISEVVRAVPGIIVGAGTVLTEHHVNLAVSAGCHFVVSPGATPALINAVSSVNLPYLPGAASSSEVMNLLDHGFIHQKFFPAAAGGGIDFLKSLASVFRDVTFCPTGGINASNVEDYLRLPNVKCVGGSWLAPETLIRAQDFQSIEGRCREAMSLKYPPPEN